MKFQKTDMFVVSFHCVWFCFVDGLQDAASNHFDSMQHPTFVRAFTGLRGGCLQVTPTGADASWKNVAVCLLLCTWRCFHATEDNMNTECT